MVALVLSSLAGLAGCGLSHSEGNSSGSNWLRCKQLSECDAAEAVSCNGQGYCTDARGERIAALNRPGTPREVEESRSCAWGVDALLAKAPISVPERASCGRVELGFEPVDTVALDRAQACLQRARDTGRAAELTVNRCTDCEASSTYVVSADGKLFEVFQRDDADANERESSIKSCGDVQLSSDRADFSCESDVQLYHCAEPRSSTPTGPSLLTPMKLSDAPNPDGKPTVTLHLYASNQSFDEPLVNFMIRIDEKRVVIGDYTVGSQHNWYAFDIEVPLGTHLLDANAGNGTSWMRDIDVSKERWLVLDYWYSSGEAAGRHFTFTESDVPVAFD
jgi:hypothetical protein